MYLDLYLPCTAATWTAGLARWLVVIQYVSGLIPASSNTLCDPQIFVLGQGDMWMWNCMFLNALTTQDKKGARLKKKYSPSSLGERLDILVFSFYFFISF